MRFLIFNLFVLCLLVVAGLLGLLTPFLAMSGTEITMLVGLILYGSLGAFCVQRGWSQDASHIANSLPMAGLMMTGLGLLLAFLQVRSLESGQLVQTFRTLGFALSPNVVGVGMMYYLREMAYWLHGDQI